MWLKISRNAENNDDRSGRTSTIQTVQYCILHLIFGYTVLAGLEHFFHLHDTCASQTAQRVVKIQEISFRIWEYMKRIPSNIRIALSSSFIISHHIYCSLYCTMKFIMLQYLLFDKFIIRRVNMLHSITT